MKLAIACVAAGAAAVYVPLTHGPLAHATEGGSPSGEGIVSPAERTSIEGALTEGAPEGSGSHAEGVGAAPLVVFADLDLDLATALMRIGIYPESLAAADVTAAEAAKVISAASHHQKVTEDALSTADAAFAKANGSVSSLGRKVRSGLASAEEVAALAAAKADLDAAELARTEAMESLFGAATMSLELGSREILMNCCHNGSWRLPTLFLIEERSEEEWIQIRDALANEKVCAADGVAPDQGCQELLTAVKSKSDVAAAMAACETHLPAIEAAWNAALGG